MKAVACQHAELSVVDRETPVPGKGQLLIEVTALPASAAPTSTPATTATSSPSVMDETGYDDFMRSDQAIIFGHEFTGRSPSTDPGAARRHATGSARGRGAADPPRRRGAHRRALGRSRPALTPSRCWSRSRSPSRCRTGWRPTIAALTEPMAVGLHAVRRGEVKKGDVAIVIGCGPVGLSVILHLKAKGVRKVDRQRLLPGPARARPGVRRGRRDRPGDGFAL